MKKLNIFSALLFTCLVLASFLYTACSKDEDSDSTILLQSWGPSPALRGGEMKFIGNNLDKVTAIVLPNDIEITTFKVKTSTLLVIDVPDAVMPGKVLLKTPEGDIEPLTTLAISEPIVLDTIQPVSARPGETVTIKGNYLNLISEVIFSSKKSVTTFVSQSKTEIQVVVPEDAQTGTVIISNGATEPIQVESSFTFGVRLPQITSISPNPVKAETELTITGTNLDLTNKIFFGGDKLVTTFLEKTATSIKVVVPKDASDGIIKLVTASLVEVSSATTLIMITPTIASITPNPAKNSNNITVTGTNLDLVSSVSFGGDKNVTIETPGTETELIVTVPADALEDIVKFNTNANKTVNAPSLALVVPTITSIAPLSTAAYQDITITGTDLDLVSKVIFKGVGTATWEAKPKAGGTTTSIVVTVTPGAVSGKINIVTTNATSVESADAITITPNVPTITNIPTVGVGELLTITGTNLDVFADIIFPGNVKATMYGPKTATSIQVYVPNNATKGTGVLKFVTSDNEILESPITIRLDIAKYFYAEALATGWQQWGGWGVTSQDWANTENPKAGTKAIKVVYAGSWGAIQAHPTDANQWGAYTQVRMSIYGGAGSAGQSLQLYIKDSGGTSNPAYTLPLTEGAWTTYTIPISALVATDIAEFVIQDKGAACTVYIDEIGLL